jgi:predicted permease
MMYPELVAYGRDYDLLHYRGNQWLAAAGRLRPGVSFAHAEQNFSALVEQLKREYWLDIFKGSDVSEWRPFLAPCNQARISLAYRRMVVEVLGMLWGVAGLVFAVACSNAVGLTLSRWMKRGREVATRVALGAGSGRLLAQSVMESLLLTAMGFCGGVLVSRAAVRVLASFPQPFQVRLLIDTQLDRAVLAYALGLSLVGGLLLSIIPLRQATKADLFSALRSGWGSGRRERRIRSVLAVVQIGFSLALVLAAGLFVRTLQNAEAKDVTHDPASVLLLRINLPRERYEPVRGKQFHASLLERVRAQPGVQNAALVDLPPLGGRINARDILPPGGGPLLSVRFDVVSDGYFESIGVPVVRGRSFSRDDRDGAPAVAIVNERMAQQFWPGADPIGKLFHLQRPVRAVGVVGIVRDGPYRNHREPVLPCFYLPVAQNYQAQMSLEVRVKGDKLRVADRLRKDLVEIDQKIALSQVQTLKDYRDKGLGRERAAARLLTAFSILAVVIAGIGLFGLLSSFVAQRTHEIGVRMALGARSTHILGMVIRECLALVGCGLAIGVLIELTAVRWIANLLYEVRATDAAAYLGATAVLLATALSASFVPARRATCVDPAVALRHD